jgi:hypothetical protein
MTTPGEIDPARAARVESAHLLAEIFLRNADSGDDAANDDLVGEMCARIRRRDTPS